ncbi:hypothetical protein OQZ33_00555 [Pedobacter sp. MC2016-05]|uniref:hypothetical protein n=1 Tax=Pedobacter sp. MC2016-05 TaxID=2994474 RepID=UPI0022451BB3|nr:hypothetical protein [Pedobacter sp. MC2016-05]MCX2472808.1 hypothetical protein [Pedobacter sp. MC2016-05]
MKKHSIILSLVVLTMGLSSCLKDDLVSDQKYGMINVGTTGAYDGIYTIGAGSSVQRYSAPNVPTVGDALNGSLEGKPNLTLSAIDANTVQIATLTWATGAALAGIDRLQAVIDPATNLVTMKSLTNLTLKNVSGKVNKYDPATKTFTLNFDWNQTTAPRAVSLVIRYKSDR